MILLPKRFFITSGCADSPVSDLNAFDLALFRAGISEQNLVAVSSVLPVGAEEISYLELEMGAVTHCVLSQMRGTEGEVISAGIATAYRADGKGGYVAEGHLHGSADCLEDDLRAKMKESEKPQEEAATTTAPSDDSEVEEDDSLPSANPDGTIKED